MEGEAKTAKAKAGARAPAAKRSRSRPRARDEKRTVEQRLTDALAQQAATAEILRVMAASPNDVQPTLDAVAQQACHLCRSPFARIFLVDGDTLRPVADYSIDGEPSIPAHAVPLRRTSVTGRATIDRVTIHHADVVPLLDTVYPDARANAKESGIRAFLAVPLMRDGGAYGSILLWRREPELFAPDHVALVETFATQAAIAIANVRLFRATQEALEQQTATGEILRVISSSPTDVQPVFETIAANALRLCDGVFSALLRFDGEQIHIGALQNLGAEGVAAFRTAYPCVPNRGGASQRAILTGRIVHIPDIREDPEYVYLNVAKRADFRSALSVPMMRDGQPIGTITVYRDVPRPFPDSQIDLLKTFADQAVIAIENVRLFSELEVRNTDLTEALEQQTATSEILRVISTSPTDVKPVFDTIAASALKLCRANSAIVTTLDGDTIRLTASANVSEETAQRMRQRYPRPRGRSTATARAIETRSVAMIPDSLADPEYDVANASEQFRSAIGVPLLREGVPIGAIGIGRAEPGVYDDKQVGLLKTFADQAVIAIENVRLFKELEARNRDLTEALEQQTATSDILRVISSSRTDVQPVFETIAAAALRLCRASSAIVSTFDGRLIELQALANVHPEGTEAIRNSFPRQPSHISATARAILTRSIVAIPDIHGDPDYGELESARALGLRSVIAVPLLREENPIGAIAVWRQEPGPFADAIIPLLQTFADQAVIAIENVRLFNELEARTTQLTRSVGELRALGDVGQAVSSTLDLETVLSTIVSRATELSGMDGGSIYEYDEVREEFYLHTADRLPDDLVAALRATPIRKGEGALGQMLVTGEPVQIKDIRDEGSYQSRVREKLLRLGFRSLLVVPLTRDNHLLGGLAVNRKSPGEFDADVIALLKTFATQSALAIQNARLFREIELKGRQLEVASQHKSEFLANMSHELRTPLNAIIGFSEVLSERLFGEMNEKQSEYVRDITESGRHLLSLINEILDLSKIEAGRMELDLAEFDLGTAIGNTLTLVRERAERRGIRLSCAIDDEVTTIHADERKVKQVLLNLLSNALKFTPEGGAIEITTRVADVMVEVSVTDTGVGIAPEDLETVFDEFRQVGSASKKIEGTGLGLAISRKFVELHGGRIRVTSTPGTGSTFAFTLPRH